MRDDIHKRIDWPLGRVIKVIPGRDGEIRVVKIKTENGELVRPVQRLYPLEITTPEAEEILNKSLERSKNRDNKTFNVKKTLAVPDKEVQIRCRADVKCVLAND